jgi:hypothetical protein
MNSNELVLLQIEQEHHDKLAHQEILDLPVDRRVTHMALHFAKYAGRLVGLQPSKTGQIERFIVDTAIICLCSANAIRMDLNQALLSSNEPASTVEPATVPAWFGLQITVHNAEIAKACEAIDHREEFPYDDVWRTGIAGILRASLVAASAMQIDLVGAIRARWAGIEKRIQRRVAA